MLRSRTMKSRRWNVAPADDRAAEMADRLRVSRVVAQVLINRGLVDDPDCLAFLKPNLRCLHEPSLIPGLTGGAQIVARAIRDKKQIVIYGDYDVDGITATAILWHAIRMLGGNVRYYIPHRVDEGYGLNTDAIRQLAADGAQLILTVDCGVTAIEPADVARELSVELVITDHHEWKEGASNEGQGASTESLAPWPSALAPHLPNAAAVVHPRLPAESVYPNPHLCGAGVAFKLAWGIGQAMTGASRVNDQLKAFLVEAMALAALGTIADVVPLVGENRILAHFGLGGLKQTKLVGLRALIDSANLMGQKIDSYHVGFLLAPRLNACGRMGHARLAVEMLTDASEDRATEIATYLESQNRQRQNTERAILDKALEQIESLRMIENDWRAIVVGDRDWHPGVIGIVASRIVDRFCRPTIVVGLSDEIGQGSGRSVDGFHLARALQNVTHTLESHGGHEMAAGLKVLPNKFEAFRDAFVSHVNESIDPQLLVPELRVDCDAEIKQITEALVGDLSRLGPFGRGNPKPLLRCRGLSLTAAPRKVGKTGDHLQLYVKQNGAVMKAIAFGAGAMFDQLQAGTIVDVACLPQVNEFNGYRSVELEVKDLQIVEG
jgi:single-stranded-DNA-specific exonuclease